MGLSSTDRFLALPPSLRRPLGIGDSPSARELSAALQTLVGLVEARSEEDQVLAVVAWNLHPKWGANGLPEPAHDATDEWLARCKKARADFRLRWNDESSIRKQTDRVIFEVLLQLVPQDEAYPKSSVSPRASQRGEAAPGSLASEFFAESYVDISDGFRAAMRRSSTLSLLGYSHNRMAVTFAADLGRMLDELGSLRVLMLDPEDPIIYEANERSYAPKDHEHVRHQHEAAYATLSAIGRRAGPGRFEMRLMNRLPPYTVYLFDEEDARDGEAYVWLTPWRRPSGQRPGFRLTAINDVEWYAYFKEQVNSLWRHYEPSAT